MRNVLPLLLLSFIFTNLFSQDKKESITSNDENFKIEDLSYVILYELNHFRASKGLDTLDISEKLQSAGELSAEKVLLTGKDKIEPNETLEHLLIVGAARRGEELTMKIPITNGRENYKLEEVAKTIFNRWETNPKNLLVLTNPKFTLVGIVCLLSSDGKKVFVSAVFGGFDINNEGVIYKKQLAVPYNTKSKKLEGPDVRKCKNCERWRNYDLLQKGLYVKNGKIYLKYPNAKELKRLLKKTTDGLAFDIVQRSQYLNADYNIIDYNLYNKCVMGKVIYRDKFFNKNLLVSSSDPKQKKKIKAIEVELGKFNPKITGPYEINLIVVQDEKVCRTITRGYTETIKIDNGNTPFGILPAKNSVGLTPPFKPRNESSISNFIIPFEKNKSEFKQQDIQPFIKALNEPNFLIDGLFVYTYCSLEGDSVANAKLQRKRGESVANVLQSFQNNKIRPAIETKDSWELFTSANENGKYESLVSMGKRNAVAKINSDQNLQKELEPLLAKQRFAQIIMDITYDVSGNNEQKFSTVIFEQAIKSNNINKAFKIMEFIGKNIAETKYPESLLDSLKLDETATNVSLINNKIYYKYQINNSVDEEDEETFKRLLKLDPTNPILQYNKLYCQLKLDTIAGSAQHQEQMQQNIDALYGKIDSSYVNGLNIEWQFKIMESLDTLANSDAQIDACIERIKSFYKIKDANWQNALKLSYIFSRAKDYRYSATLLEPYLNKPDVPENFVFMYISIASRVQDKYYSRIFAHALEIAKKINPTRYCKLFGEPFMTFQVLENPDIKKVYTKSCTN